MDSKRTEDVFKPVTEAEPEVRRVVARVLQIEQEKLYLQRPRVVDDLLIIVKEEVR